MEGLQLKLTETLQTLSEAYGTGFLRQDILFVLVIGVCFFTLIGSFIFVRTRKSRNKILGDDFQRLTGVVGRIERFEKEVNEFRTDLMREVEFLKRRVAELESGRGVVTGSVPSETPRPSQKREPRREDKGTEKSESAVLGERRGSDKFALLEDDDSDSEDDPSGESSSSLPIGDSFPEVDREKYVTERAEPEAQQKPTSLPGTLPSKPESLTKKLGKTRKGLFDRLKSVFVSSPKLDEETVDELEALLVGSDLGVKLSTSLIEDVKEEISAGNEVDENVLTSLLKMKVLGILETDAPLISDIQPKRRGDFPLIVMMVGVNGVGKTTTTAKLASQWSKSGAKVLMAAADTFRAAAVEQLVEWGNRIDVPVVRGGEQSKPSAVVFDATQRAVNENFDVLIIDTAGRLHTKSNLMQELEGLRNVVQKHVPDGPHESILVLDGSTGQNALNQAKEFNQAVPLSGVVVTKLDGTPKGGIVVAIKDEIGIPVRYIGVGESEHDLRSFVARDFVEALFNTSTNTDLESPSAHGKKRRRRRREPDAASA